MNIYLLIALLHGVHNKRMGGTLTGVIVALAWPVAVGLWLWGAYAEWKEDTELMEVIKEEEKNGH